MNVSGEVLRERLTRIRNDRRAPVVVLFLAMAVSAVVTLYLGRDVDFSGDELVWVASSPGLNLDIVLQPHGGHLLALTRGVYWVVLETFGLGYLPFRLLALLAMLAAVGTLFFWGRRRADPWIALAPCLILLFFGSDFLHLFQGNGFTVMLSLALGVGALIAIERRDRLGDAVCCALLSLGIVTYTVILPFVAGVGLILLLGGRYRRLWVVAVPIVMYVAWRIWLLAADVPATGGGLHPSEILTVPAWIFQSLGGILAALSGVGFAFGTDGLSAANLAGPPLALLGFVLLGFAISRHGLRTGLAAAILITVSLWALQALASDGSALRLPGGDTRYMYPGAFVVILVGLEAVGRWRPGRGALVATVILVLAGIGTNLHLMSDNARDLEGEGQKFRTISGTMRLVVEYITASRPDLKIDHERVGDSPTSVSIAMSGSPYGKYAFDPDELAAQPLDLRERADRMLVPGMQIRLTPSPDIPGDCRLVAAGKPFPVHPGRFVLASGEGGEVLVGRFDDQPRQRVGAMQPGVPTRLDIPSDSSRIPWQIELTEGGNVCS